MIIQRLVHRCRSGATDATRVLIRLSVIAIVALPALVSAEGVTSRDHRFSLEFETGAVWQSRNQIQIPDSSAGTRFGLTDIQGNGPDAQRRVELTWNINHRHSLRFVYAPLGFSGTGSFGFPVRFAGGTFAPGVPVHRQGSSNSAVFPARVARA